MMPQMESGGQQNEQAYYGGYGAQQQQQYGQPPRQTPPQGNTYDDNFVEAVSARIIQRLNQGSAGKIYSGHNDPNRLSAGQRLALAIVSMGLLVPISAILLGTLGPLGLFGLGLVCLTIILVNGFFNFKG